MKFWFLLVVVVSLISSCGVQKSQSNRNFSKRQHLKGYFWNKKSSLRSSNVKNPQKEKNELEVNTLSPQEQSNEPLNRNSQLEERFTEDETVEIIANKSETVLDAPLNREPSISEVESDEKEPSLEGISEENLSGSNSPKTKFNNQMLSFAFAGILLFLGVLVFIIGAVLNAAEVTGPILMIVGGSIAGLALIYLIFCVIYVFTRV